MRPTLRTLLALGLAAAPIHASAQALGGDLADLARIRQDVTKGAETQLWGDENAPE
jgi:hypothetical protein